MFIPVWVIVVIVIISFLIGLCIELFEILTKY